MAASSPPTVSSSDAGAANSTGGGNTGGGITGGGNTGGGNTGGGNTGGGNTGGGDTGGGDTRGGFLDSPLGALLELLEAAAALRGGGEWTEDGAELEALGLQVTPENPLQDIVSL